MLTREQALRVFRDVIVKECEKILISKGQNYSENNNTLSNFYESAADAEIDVLKAWWVFTKKHLDAIKRVVRRKRVEDGESVEGRFYDAINYMLLGFLILFIEHPEDLRKETIDKVIKAIHTKKLNERR
ncbi:MAG: hypothetical protein QW279_01245 [Candidatus Jordarchaeaceae archaeon]